MRFSIIIPVYNVKEYIDECIESVLNQDYCDYEIVLVDDGSTDGSGEICDRYMKKYSFVKVIHQRNQGLSGARNTGVATSQGEYLVFLDSDDILLNNESLGHINQIVKDQDIIVYDISEFSDSNRVSMSNYSVTEAATQDSYDSGIEYLLDVLNTNISYRWYACTYAYRRTFWVENNFEFPLGRKYEDIPTTYRVLLKSKEISILREKVYGYRRNRMGAITQAHSYTSLFDMFDMESKAIDYINSQSSRLPGILVNKLCTNMSISIYVVLILASKLNKQDLKKISTIIDKDKEKMLYAANYNIKYRIMYILTKILGSETVSKLLGMRTKMNRRNRS